MSNVQDFLVDALLELAGVKLGLKHLVEHGLKEVARCFEGVEFYLHDLVILKELLD